jgi:hypothetical protein
VRIVRWRYKLTYVVASLLLGHVVFAPFIPHGPALSVLRSAYDLGIVLVGARIFRGSAEDVRASRV